MHSSSSSTTMNRARRNWTPKEDALLRELVQKELSHSRPLLWRELAKQIPGRSNKDCRKRWWNSLAGGTVKGAWSAEEDKRLIEAVEKYGTKWTKVAALVGSRCGDQCSSHWRQALNPNINYCDWTDEEDAQLLEAVSIYGTNWSTIASMHPTQRTTLALKNRYWKLRPRQTEIKSSSDGSSSSPHHAKSRSRTKKTSATSSDPRSTEYDESEEDGDNRNDDSEVDDSHALMHQANGHDWMQDWQTHQMGDIPYDPTEFGMSGEQWLDDMAQQMIGAGDGAGLLSPRDSLLSPELTAVLTKACQEDSYHNYNFGALDGSLCLDSDIFASEIGSPAATFASAALSPDQGGSYALTPAMLDSMLEEKHADKIKHQISIKLSCTTTQLSEIMSLLARTSSVVDVKINTQ